MRESMGTKGHYYFQKTEHGYWIQHSWTSATKYSVDYSNDPSVGHSKTANVSKMISTILAPIFTPTSTTQQQHALHQLLSLRRMAQEARLKKYSTNFSDQVEEAVAKSLQEPQIAEKIAAWTTTKSSSFIPQYIQWLQEGLTKYGPSSRLTYSEFYTKKKFPRIFFTYIKELTDVYGPQKTISILSTVLKNLCNENKQLAKCKKDIAKKIWEHALSMIENHIKEKKYEPLLQLSMIAATTAQIIKNADQFLTMRLPSSKGIISSELQESLDTTARQLHNIFLPKKEDLSSISFSLSHTLPTPKTPQTPPETQTTLTPSSSTSQTPLEKPYSTSSSYHSAARDWEEKYPHAGLLSHHFSKEECILFKKERLTQFPQKGEPDATYTTFEYLLHLTKNYEKEIYPEEETVSTQTNLRLQRYIQYLMTYSLQSGILSIQKVFSTFAHKSHLPSSAVHNAQFCFSYQENADYDPLNETIPKGWFVVTKEYVLSIQRTEKSSSESFSVTSTISLPFYENKVPDKLSSDDIVENMCTEKLTITPIYPSNTPHYIHFAKDSVTRASSNEIQKTITTSFIEEIASIPENAIDVLCNVFEPLSISPESTVTYLAHQIKMNWETALLKDKQTTAHFFELIQGKTKSLEKKIKNYLITTPKFDTEEKRGKRKKEFESTIQSYTNQFLNLVCSLTCDSYCNCAKGQFTQLFPIYTTVSSTTTDRKEEAFNFVATVHKELTVLNETLPPQGRALLQTKLMKELSNYIIHAEAAHLSWLEMRYHIDRNDENEKNRALTIAKHLWHRPQNETNPTTKSQAEILLTLLVTKHQATYLQLFQEIIQWDLYRGHWENPNFFQAIIRWLSGRCHPKEGSPLPENSIRILTDICKKILRDAFLNNQQNKQLALWITQTIFHHIPFYPHPASLDSIREKFGSFLNSLSRRDKETLCTNWLEKITTQLKDLLTKKDYTHIKNLLSELTQCLSQIDILLFKPSSSVPPLTITRKLGELQKLFTDHFTKNCSFKIQSSTSEFGYQMVYDVHASTPTQKQAKAWATGSSLAHTLSRTISGKIQLEKGPLIQSLHNHFVFDAFSQLEKLQEFYSEKIYGKDKLLSDQEKKHLRIYIEQLAATATFEASFHSMLKSAFSMLAKIQNFRVADSTPPLLNFCYLDETLILKNTRCYTKYDNGQASQAFDIMVETGFLFNPRKSPPEYWEETVTITKK